MRTILIYSKKRPNGPFDMQVSWGSNDRIVFITEAMFKAQPNKMMGYDFNLIVNMDYPPEEMQLQQMIRAAEHGAQIIDLWKEVE